jgi:hypothetical protein
MIAAITVVVAGCSPLFIPGGAVVLEVFDD